MYFQDMRTGLNPGRVDEEQPPVDQVSAWKDELLSTVAPGGFVKREPEKPRLLDRRYRLLHRLGRGGMGTIWCAEHAGFGRHVAIKFLHEDTAGSPVPRQRFLREGRLAATVRHPGVVDVLDVGETADGQAFLVMELLEGMTIEQRVREEGTVSAVEVQSLLLELTDALIHVHDRGVVHRDIKPSNIMLCDGRTKLIDFGLAGMSEASLSLTKTGNVLGSPAYMSPEQFRGEEADARSDVYSLGCVAYFMVAGQRPFDGSTPAELMYQHLMAEPPQLPARDPTTNAFNHILRRACAKLPDARFETMQAFRDALARMFDLPETTGRKKALLAAGVLVPLLAVSGVSLAGRESNAARLLETQLLDLDFVRSVGTPAVNLVANPKQPSVRSVHAGEAFTCALLDDESVRCWGKQGPHLCQPDFPGHLGDDELPYALPALRFGDHAIRSIDTEYFAAHVCAILDDHSLRCWGDDRFGQLGRGEAHEHWCDSPEESLANLEPIEIPPVIEVHTHQYGTCALAGAQDERGVYCWGRNRYGQAGLGHRNAISRPASQPLDLGGAQVASMTMGIHTACALFEESGVRCWGANHRGQMGVRDFSQSAFIGDGRGDRQRGMLPNDASLNVQGFGEPGEFDVSIVRANGGWNCAVSEQGKVRCWGGNQNGILGLRHDQIPGCESDTDGARCFMRSADRDVDLGDAKIVDLQMGRLRACALDDQGAVRCWGWGERGALGYGREPFNATGFENIGMQNTPAEAYAAMGHDGVVDVGDFDHDGNIDRVVQLTLGYTHACALIEDGTVRCWGGNSEGQLGYGTIEDIGDDETPAQYYKEHGCGAVPISAGQGCTQTSI